VPLFTKPAKLVAALLRVAGVTAGLTESNGSLPPVFMTHVTCRLTAKNRDQLRKPTNGNRVWATFTFLHSSMALILVDLNIGTLLFPITLDTVMTISGV